MEYLQHFIDDKCVIGGNEYDVQSTLLLKQFKIYLHENKLSIPNINTPEFEAKLNELASDIGTISTGRCIGITLKDIAEGKRIRSLAETKRYLTTKFYNRELPEDIINAKDGNGRKIYVRVGSYDRLYMNNDQLNPNNLDDKVYYFKLFRNRLISFAFNSDNTINWHNTIKETYELIEKYNLDHEIKIERPMKMNAINKKSKDDASECEKEEDVSEDENEEINEYHQRRKTQQHKEIH